MSTNSWPGGDGSAQAQVSPTQRVLDGQMIKHLLSRYGADELSRLIQETSSTRSAANEFVASDGASIMSSTQSSILSDDQSSVWDNQSVHSVRTFSDTSSITGSIMSNVSRGTSKILGRRSQSSSASAAAQAQAAQQAAQNQQEQQSWNGTDSQSTPEAANASGASKQKGAFMCGFCKEEDITKTCTRKNDLKRHIEDFHNVNAQWFCRHRGCQMVFDWQGAYKTHLKQAHGGSRMSLDEAKVNLCPQVVFACGFDNCLQVFEAQGDSDASSTFKEYVTHVVKHFDEGANSGEWTYSARIRNLLRQSQVQSAWNESMWNEATRTSLQWSPQTSGILRKRLECRHIGDLKLLVQYAFMLGTDPSSVGKFREDFITPVADTCTMHMPGHKSRQQSVAPPEPADPFSFKISRGANPALAAYMASQRRVYVPRQQRVMRPAQLHHPHQQVPTSSAMASQTRLSRSSHSSHHSQQGHDQNHSTLGHFFQTMPESPMYDPNGGQFGNNSTMHHNGIIADDMQSLRGMAGGTPEQSDVEMQDPGMMADFSSQYAPSMNGQPDNFFPPGQAY
ncbi:homeobox and C2H2 transcription protein [Colletotrichum plurivorum]|uniref:Homeobox and C2H2 transcription protein n=1 Tax=Colletotrichum plurivorum TaxID=2175906 RepID=A0A8H6KCK9_9PEZI|nr:homeobox and C2H2 transcription protein [Colletotrichum plurivorum]